MKVRRTVIARYMIKYNSKRLHSTIDHKTPNEVYFENINILRLSRRKTVTISIGREWNKESCFTGLEKGEHYDIPFLPFFHNLTKYSEGMIK